MDLVISDPQSGKAYSKRLEDIGLFKNKKIGEQVQLDSIGVPGYTIEITGGSDKQGFPMKKDLTGTNRKKIFLVHDQKKGTRKRISKRGNIFADDINQVNAKVVKAGPKPLAELLSSEAPKEEKKTAKEELMEEIQSGAAEKKLKEYEEQKKKEKEE